MVDATRALLDELMGKERNVLPAERRNSTMHFYDSEVCKYYICGFCPHTLFTNTKSDLGTCEKIHDDIFKEEFRNCPTRFKYPYERDFIHFLQGIIDDLDKRIRRGHARLDVNLQEETVAPVASENAEKINAIDQRIQTLLKQIEDLGEEGKVDESQQMMQLVENLKTEKELLTLGQDIRTVSAQEKRMKVCDICGAFLVVGDTDKRLSSHLEGKQHQGFALIRKTLEDHKNDLRYDSRRINSSGSSNKNTDFIDGEKEEKIFPRDNSNSTENESGSLNSIADIGNNGDSNHSSPHRHHSDTNHNRNHHHHRHHHHHQTHEHPRGRQDSHYEYGKRHYESLNDHEQPLTKEKRQY